MSKSVLLALSLPLGLLVGCKANEPTFEEIPYPVMTLGQASLEYGEAAWGGSVERTVLLSNEGGMPMGVESIIIGDADAGTSSFTVAYDPCAIECPEAAAGDTAAAAKSIDVDTGEAPGTDTGTTDPGTDTAGGTCGGGDDTALFVLDPGCHVPVTVTYTPVSQGEAYDALVVTSVGLALTAEEEDEGVDLPAYKEDPIRTQQVVYLHGESNYAQGAVIVRPRSFDFGYVHPDAADAEAPARIQIGNVGDGDVTIIGAELSSSCDEASFVLERRFEDNFVLGGDATTLAEVTFTPTDTNPAICQLLVYTDDPANPEVDVTLTGNSGTDPENVPPSVYVRWPENGYRYNTIRPLTLELNIFDVNQPAGSLVCRVKSAVIQNATVADCAADDASGHVYVEVPAENLEPGTDTLLISVTDGSQTTSYASVSILINGDYPEDDDDGDGFGVNGDAEGLNADCDDANILTYPSAAEVFDLADNDCDGTIDEGTEGFDDDGDGVTEADGDCNDYSNDAFPGAPERGDGLDNDCDGVADETTGLYDDDGDGYAEVNNDCNDNDATVNPSATEICDGVDNDCDGLRDSADGCAETEAPAVLAGNIIRMEQSACLEGEVITMDVLVYDPDADTITFTWSTDDPTVQSFDNPAAPVVNFTCPEIAGDSANSGRNENIYVVIADDDGTDWAFGRIAVWDENTELYEPYTKVIPPDPNASGCSTTGGTPVGALLAFGAMLGLAVRRRD
jgi:uncharacterized protein (TIGR03382 family)